MRLASSRSRRALSHSRLLPRAPAQVAYSVGKVGFANNRRRGYAARVVDHELPVLRVTSPEGKVRALLTSYAPGQSVKLTILRDGKQLDVTVTLGTRPKGL